MSELTDDGYVEQRPPGHVWDERKKLSDVLLDVWDAAEARGDWAMGDDIKIALDALGLPWVRMTNEMFHGARKAGRL